MSSPYAELLAELAHLGIPEAALEVRGIRSSGPGGQNVNKVATAIQLNCALAACELSEPVQRRLAALAGRRLNQQGILGISAQRLRTQEQNKRDALQRLLELLQKARVAPKIRIATKPSKGAKLRRLEGKQQRSRTKNLRRSIPRDE